MRQFIASAVMAAIVFSAASPTFAQRTTRRVNKPAPASSRTPQGAVAEFGQIQAVTAGTGVLISWLMKSENRVAGYQIFRIEGTTRIPVGQFVLGSAAKSNVALMYGNRYSAYDPSGDAKSVYVIEGSGMTGGSAMSNQFAPTFQRSAALAIAQADSSLTSNAAADSVETFTQSVPTPSAAAPNLANQQWVASQPGVKIAVNKEGLFRVTRAELSAAGFFGISGSNTSANWRLFMEGNEQPIIVGPSDQYIE